MTQYYIYVPVNDVQLVKVAQDWKKDSKKDIEIIVRESQRRIRSSACVAG